MDTQTKYGTNFVETEALLASQEEDQEELERLLNGMLPDELRRLGEAAENLAAEALNRHQATVAVTPDAYNQF